jgi:hypothetical protein
MQAYAQQDWQTCAAAARIGLEISKADVAYTCDPEVWGPKLHDLAAMSAYHLGHLDEARQWAAAALALAPDDQRLAANVEFLDRADEISEQGSG